MITDIFPFLQGFNTSLLLKIPLLVLIFLLLVFAFILISRVRALNRAVHISSFSASRVVQIISLLYFVAVLSLFLITLAIL